MNPTARLPHLPALDGLRALAVLAVLVYHAGTTPLHGGFLGVEIFFVISGYLITSLLVAERDVTGRVDLAQFWLRRARRLLPALAVLLVGVAAFVVAVLPDEAAKIRGDAFSAAAYFNNWFQIFNHTSYFESSGRPSLLKHLWSLSVEEQFYIVWPLLFVVLAARFRAHSAAAVLLIAAAASSVAMALLFDPDADPTRVYFGTDTRASGMLIGAALAFVCRPRNSGAGSPGERAGSPFHPLSDALGIAALASLVVACFGFTEFSPLLYRGGFALVTLATATLIAVLVRPGARVTSALLSCAPLRWLGERSYGIYLWHFPVFMLTRPQLDVTFTGLPLLALRFVITLVLAELSYRFVESPVRRGALERSWWAWREARGTAKLAWTLRWATAGFAMSAAVSTLGVALLLARPPVAPVGGTGYQPVPSGYQPDGKPGATEDVFAMGENSAGQVAPQDGLVAGSTGQEERGQDHAERVTRARVTLYEDLPPAPIFPDSRVVTNVVAGAVVVNESVVAIGDSVMEGVSNEMVRAFGSNIVVDAKQGRQAAAALTTARELRAAGKLSGTVILHIGNNGIFRDATFEKIMAEFADAQRVVIVNCKVPRAWEQPNNEMLAAAVRRHANAVLVDWHTVGGGRPELFWKDGLHLKPGGAKVYAGLIAEAVGGRGEVVAMNAKF